MNTRTVQYWRYAVCFFSPRKRHRIARAICGQDAVFLPGDMLLEARTRGGFLSLMRAEAVLFGWCGAAALLLDLFFPGSPLMKAAIGCACCLTAFGLCRDDAFRAGIKVLIALTASFLGGSCFAAVILLLIFENACASVLGGGDDGDE